jgi:hypothetical protein
LATLDFNVSRAAKAIMWGLPCVVRESLQDASRGTLQIQMWWHPGEILTSRVDLEDLTDRSPILAQLAIIEMDGDCGLSQRRG